MEKTESELGHSKITVDEEEIRANQNKTGLGSL